jgi:hypothetical protein
VIRSVSAVAVTAAVLIGTLAFAPVFVDSAHAQQSNNAGELSSSADKGGEDDKDGKDGKGDKAGKSPGGGGAVSGGGSGGGGSSNGPPDNGSSGGSQPGPNQNSSSSGGGKSVLVVSRVFNVANDAKKTGKTATLSSDTEGVPVSANIPVASVPGTEWLLFTVTAVNETVIAPLPGGTQLAPGMSFDIEFYGDGDELIERLDDSVEFTVDVDTTVPPDTALAAFLLDADGEWVQLPTAASEKGVAFTTKHLTLFALLRVPTVRNCWSAS